MKAVLRLDRDPPDLQEERRIVAEVDELDELVLSFSVPAEPGTDPVPDITADSCSAAKSSKPARFPRATRSSSCGCRARCGSASATSTASASRRGARHCGRTTS